MKKVNLSLIQDGIFYDEARVLFFVCECVYVCVCVCVCLCVVVFKYSVWFCYA
jgi:hypothetical protein